MSQQGYDSETVTVGSISDKLLLKPNGSGVQEITPTIPAAIAQTAANTLPTPAAAFYTKGSATVLTLTLPSVPGFTTGSKMGVFWEDGTGVPHYCLDCTITSVTGNVVVITAPGTILFDQTDFTSITAGTTEVTFSVANLATSDQPGNQDLVDYVLTLSAIEQLLLTANDVGGFSFCDSGGACLFSWNYTGPGGFYNFISGTPPWSGSVVVLRFYNASLAAQTMKIGALMS